METFLEEWNTKFGPGVEPPEWVSSLGPRVHQQPENVGKIIGECIERIDKLKQQLDGELFVLSWLRKLKVSAVKVEVVGNGPEQVNHVQEDVFVDSVDHKEPLVTSTASRKPKLAVNVPGSFSPNFDTARDRLVISRSEDSPNSSEYYTAGPNSCSDTTSLSNLTEEEPSPVLIRQRFNQHVTSNDIQVAKLVRSKVGGKRHWSCLNLSQVATDGTKFFRKSSPKGRRKRNCSAPELDLKVLHRVDSSKKRVFSDPCTRDEIEAKLLQGDYSPLPPLVSRKVFSRPGGTHTLPAANRARADSEQSSGKVLYSGQVVLRDKSKRGRSYSMDSGGTSSVAGKRSSNGYTDYLEGCNYVTSPTGTEDDDNDPALINVMASRYRGTLRTPRTSTSQAPSSPDHDTTVTSPEAGSSRHYSASGSESDTFPLQLPQSGDGKHFVRRRNTVDSSPIKRISYVSDDECLTPRVDPGSPFGSQGCSHRNSRSSNGILDEESSMELTLKRTQYGPVDDMDRTVSSSRKRNSTENGTSPDHHAMQDDNNDNQLTKTLKAYSLNFGGSFDESPSDSLSGLGQLEVDIAATLSKFGDRPEMSMAGLLDVKENRQMNTDPRHVRGGTSSALEELYEESIEVDEATISAFTIHSDYLCSSRSNSANSLPGLFSDNISGASSSPPEQESPSHSSTSLSMMGTGATTASVAMQGVNLRPVGAGRRRNVKRMGNADLEAMTVGKMGGGRSGGLGGSDTDNKSVSSTSLNSEEDSSVPTSPQMTEREDLMSPDSRLSRMFPVRHSTVVVHGGEQLVIRKLVIVGVLSAEKTYIECLSVAMEYYRKPLLARTTVSQPIIPEKDINTIFYRIEDLHSLHKNLCDQLETILVNWSVLSCVGDFFVELCRNLKLYKDYVEMFQKAVECLNRNKLENPQFKKFIEDVYVTVTKTNKDIPKINELLRRPIERLQSYSLVLNDLCQHTPKDHSDYRILRESLQAMSAFIASTHDPQAFRELSGGYNRELVKEGVVVELSEGIRKVRRVFLFHDVLVSAKQKPTRTSMKFEAKWYLPLNELSFKCPDGVTKKPVPVSSEMEMSVMKNKIAELRAQVSQYNSRDRERSGTAAGEGFNIKRNIFMIKYGGTKQSEKVKKKLEEQKVLFWVASPSLPLRLYGNNGKQYMFLLHNEEERESWLSAIKKLQPKAVSSVALSSFELQDLLNRQTINDLQKVEEMIIPTAEDDYLSGVLRVRVMSATDLKAKPASLYCCLELDEYGKFERKARTLPANNDPVTLITTWDQDFEFELVGSHNLKIVVCSKSLLKEETHAHGKMRLPIKELRQNKRQRMKISLAPQGVISIVIEYFSNMASVSRKPAMQSSGVFGLPIEVVAKRERHDIPLIVQTCVDEVEKRGLSEVGVYRVVGVLRDVEELRQSFDSDYLKAQMIAYDTDIHAVAGLLKRYFRELPDPLFTEELYSSFVQVLGLSDPEARAQCFHSLLHSLPPVNLKTAIFLFKHLRRVGANSAENKMTLTNLATVFGPNLLHPGNSDASAFNMDVVTPVSVVLYYLNCPEEFFDEIPESSPENTAGSPRSGTDVRRRESASAADANPERVVMRDRSVGDSGFYSSQKFRRASKRSSTKGTPKHSGNAPVRSAASFKSPSSSSVSQVTPARESII